MASGSSKPSDALLCTSTRDLHALVRAVSRRVLGRAGYRAFGGKEKSVLPPSDALLCTRRSTRNLHLGVV